MTRTAGHRCTSTTGKDPWICTYDARYLRITAVGQAGRQLSVAELDVFGPSGDDVSFLDANGGAAGILKSDFVYQKADENLDKQFIPKGSLVFTGSYKGNPAYNVVVLYDENGQRGGRRERRRQHGCQPDHHGA